MTPKPVTPAELARLRAAFTSRRPSSPSDFAAVAADVGVTSGQARRAWLYGWAAAGIAPLERELGSAAAAQRQLGVAVATAEMVADECVRRAAELGEHVAGLVPVAKRLVAALVDAPDLAQLAPSLALSALRQVTSVLGRAGNVAADAVELQRLVGGQAGRIVAVQHGASPDTIDIEAAARTLAGTQRALERAAKARAPAAPDVVGSTEPTGDPRVN